MWYFSDHCYFLYLAIANPSHTGCSGFIDVNLGNEKEGMGNIQPLVKGERVSR